MVITNFIHLNNGSGKIDVKTVAYEDYATLNINGDAGTIALFATDEQLTQISKAIEEHLQKQTERSKSA